MNQGLTMDDWKDIKSILVKANTEQLKMLLAYIDDVILLRMKAQAKGIIQG